MARVKTQASRRRETVFDPRDIFAALNAAKARYLVVGGLAVVLYGILRTTYDVDLSVELTTDNLQRLAKGLAGLGFVPRLPVPLLGLADAKTRQYWMRRRGMRVYSFIEPAGMPPRNIDVMIEPPRNFERLYGARHIVTLRRVRVPLMPAQELARMKRQAGRPQDLQDIQDLRLAGRIS